MNGRGTWGVDDGMAVCAVRYCLGRRTYVVSECCDWLRSNWSQFSERGRIAIRKEIEHAIKDDDAARERKNDLSPYYPLGMDMDRAEWVQVAGLWRAPK